MVEPPDERGGDGGGSGSTMAGLSSSTSRRRWRSARVPTQLAAPAAVLAATRRRRRRAVTVAGGRRDLVLRPVLPVLLLHLGVDEDLLDAARLAVQRDVDQRARRRRLGVLPRPPESPSLLVLGRRAAPCAGESTALPAAPAIAITPVSHHLASTTKSCDKIIKCDCFE